MRKKNSADAVAGSQMLLLIIKAFQANAAGLGYWRACAIYQRLENAMSKGMDSKKAKKKEPLKTPKEKKADKKAKKDAK